MLHRLSVVFALASAVLAFSCASAIAQEDPFRWLEAPNDPAALKWAREQTDQTKKELAALPDYAAVSAELARLLGKAPSAPQIFLIGPHALRFSKSVAHPHGLLEVADRGSDGAPGAWRTALDVDALRASEGKPYEFQSFYVGTSCAPPNFDRCLFGLSLGGSDEGELREFDLGTGKFVTDGFRSTPGRNFFTWLDVNTVLISSNAVKDPNTTSAAGFSVAVRLWKRGASLSAAPVVWRGETTDDMAFLSSFGAGASRTGVITRVVNLSTYRSFVLEPGGSVRPVELPSDINTPLGNTERHFIFQTTQPAVIKRVSVPANTIVAYDSDPATAPDRRLSVVYAPRPDETVISDGTVPQVAITRSTVNFVVVNHLVQRPVTARFKHDTWVLERGDARPVGTTTGYYSADNWDDDYIMLTTGFLVPSHYDLMREGVRVANLYQEQPGFEASRYLVEPHTVNSSDATTIDYYLLRPKNLTHAGSTPTLITAYGGFGVTPQPTYLSPLMGGAALTTWLSRGGAVAFAGIRGGGEHGEAWHRAALGVNRQRAYDDFLAVTADLERTFTSPQHLGAFGSSNGGLLVATVAIERPDLYGAVVSDVPLTDMLRYPDMGAGSGWISEFGDPRDPMIRAALLRYSPYQNVREGVQYPPIMITDSTQDNRVGPGHARKLAARLKSVGAPVYLYEDQEGGHGVSDPLARPELMSRRMTFLIDKLMALSH